MARARVCLWVLVGFVQKPWSAREERTVHGMNPLLSLPPHVWALVLREATVSDVCCVAHVCRALHELIASGAQCSCTRDLGPFGRGATSDGGKTQAFWAHWRAVRPEWPSDRAVWDSSTDAGCALCVAMRLRCGADPSNGVRNAIVGASDRGHVAIVDVLMNDRRADPGASNQFALRLACKNGHVAVVERLLRDTRVVPHHGRQSALWWASRNGHVAIVDYLLRDGRVDPSYPHALFTACFRGHVAVVRRLLRDERVDPSVCEQAAVEYASNEGHVAIVDLLLGDARVDPSAHRQSALRWAVQEGHVAVVDRLLADERVARDAAEHARILDDVPRNAAWCALWRHVLAARHAARYYT